MSSEVMAQLFCPWGEWSIDNQSKTQPPFSCIDPDALVHFDVTLSHN